MTNKKILFIAPRFHTNQFFLVKNLIKRNVQVNFLSIYIGVSENHKYITPILSRPSILIKWFQRNKSAKLPKDREFLRKFHVTSFLQCFKIYKNINPDIVIIRNFRYFISLQHFIVGLLLRKKVFLYTLHNYRKDLSFKYKLFYNFIHILGIKHYTPVPGDLNKPVIPNACYIPMVMDPFVKKEEVIIKSQKSGIQIMTIGKMVERKKIKELVDSLFRIKFFNSNDNKLLIVAECNTEAEHTYLESIKSRIIDNHSQILFHLNEPHDKVFNLLKTSDLFILPSHKEPAGTSLVEAMACGVAVICSDSNGTKGYIKEGVNGHVFKYTSKFEYLDKVLKSSLDKKLLVNYGISSLEIIEKNHSIDTFFTHVIENN